jgi:hypothetical protein
MELDVADLARPQRELDEIVLHELLHAVGVGTFDAWAERLSGAGTPSPTFGGVRGRRVARARRLALPVRRRPGRARRREGTADSHWSERVFGTELMTGFHDRGTANALSAVTLGALRDMGYQVDDAAADAFTLPAFTSADRDGARRTRFEVVRRPLVLP